MQRKITDLAPFNREAHLLADAIGPWFVGTNKTATNARETAFSRLLSARSGGWKSTHAYQDEAMLRGVTLKPYAISSASLFTGHTFEADWVITAPGDVVACLPDGFAPATQTGLSVRVPIGATQARLRRTGPETADFWEALAGLSITGASVWYVMSFSPPFVPIIWTIHRHEWQALLDDLDQARLEFTNAFNAAHAEWMNDEQSFQVLEPIPLHFQDLLP